MFLVCFTGYGYGQYLVKGTVYIRDGKSTKTSLLIETNSKEIKVPVDLNGNFTTYLNWDTNYKLYFGKMGYVTKCVEFSTIVPDNVLKGGIYPYEILVELFPQFPDVDTVFFKKPVAKIGYSKKINDFDYDLDYQLKVQYKIDQTKKDYYSWLERKNNIPVLTKKEIDRIQKKEVVHYQKTAESSSLAMAEPQKTILKPSPPAKRYEDPFGLPPLKAQYKEGKTVEVYQMKTKTVKRVIIKIKEYQKVYFEVKHNWGGHYFFVQESPTYIRSISRYNFDKSTKD
ncbi:hypothetical protein [Plebeiibacterium marinum]|uniref:Uncharacterized protein n=1 Tax=Plebeiibacterium marinum TaxID=2992111 RepID=A0AAE3MC56_9BACT|nr:hypothetical protein [Plebeiobacterium marinum]MCW3804837.1 hypothetical protein [Plebeiobacterium marinum]